MLLFIYMFCFDTLPFFLLYIVYIEYLGIVLAAAILALYIVILYSIIIGLPMALFILLELFIVVIIINDIKLIWFLDIVVAIAAIFILVGLIIISPLLLILSAKIKKIS
jgi:hypothetical protein